MIKINATTHSVGGVTVATGSVLDVTPHIITKREKVNDILTVKYDFSFDVDIYKSLVDYKAGKPILVKDRMVEYPIGYTVKDVQLLSFTDATSLLNILKTQIENGGDGYSGVGAGNCEIVYPFQ